ncbi:MAG TPA: DUF389 domain-containing protein [Marmoricola sp.]|nr:DUF389 domain-containing protein [Marmoricola sp.]
MLHLRLRVPAELTETVLEDLAGDPTVTNVGALPDSYQQPAGDLVFADVARENATGVIGRLRDYGLAEQGAIAVDPVDTMLSRAAELSEQMAPGAPDDGVVWVQVEQKLRRDTQLSFAFVTFMTLAALIAGAGRILDQPILIVGAMVVGPEFAPIAAICFALSRPRLDMVPKALYAMLVGFTVALVLATMVWFVAYQFGAFTSYEAAHGPATDFIVKPDGWSLVVAIFAGVAGTLSLTTAKSGPLVGVFISVTTIPAVGAAAVCLAAGIWGELASCGIQLGINLAGMIVSGSIALLLQRLVWNLVVRRSTRLRNRRGGSPGFVRNPGGSV